MYNGYDSSHKIITWWWKAMKSFSNDQRAQVLSFSTGSSRMAFSDDGRKFSIHRSSEPSNSLPTAHTCGLLLFKIIQLAKTASLGVNQINLPEYKTYEILREKVLTAIELGGKGFEFM